MRFSYFKTKYCFFIILLCCLKPQPVCRFMMTKLIFRLEKRLFIRVLLQRSFIKKKEDMEKKAEIDFWGALSLVSFVIAVVAWFMTIKTTCVDLELLLKVEKITRYIGISNFHKTMEVVSLMWSVSVWYRLWIISAVASTIALWPCGGFLSLIAMTLSFILAFGGIVIPLGTIHIDTWGVIVVMNIFVFVLWCIVAIIKEAYRK